MALGWKTIGVYVREDDLPRVERLRVRGIKPSDVFRMGLNAAEKGSGKPALTIREASDISSPRERSLWAPIDVEQPETFIDSWKPPEVEESAPLVGRPVETGEEAHTEKESSHKEAAKKKPIEGLRQLSDILEYQRDPEGFLQEHGIKGKKAQVVILRLKGLTGDQIAKKIGYPDKNNPNGATVRDVISRARKKLKPFGITIPDARSERRRAHGGGKA